MADSMVALIQKTISRFAYMCRQIHKTIDVRCLCAVVAILIILSPTSSSAQALCGNADKIIEGMSNSKYAETEDWVSISADAQTIYKMMRNRKTGTWTLLHIYPNGMACIYAAGTDWQPIVPKLGGAM